MTFAFKKAAREGLPTITIISGGTGSGKTWSALALAKGMSGGKRFALIDSERGRAKHYSDFFDFDHTDMEPPFRPDRYLEAIQAADAAGYSVVVIDQFSSEWVGDGGCLDWHEEILDRMCKGDNSRRQALQITAWIEVKMSHKRLVQKMLQVKAHLILALRAEEKIDIIKEDGKTKIVPKKSVVGLDGWVPISEKNLPYEATCSFLLTADKPGVPKPIKLQTQHKPFFPLDRPISEESGRLLADWASGGVKPPEKSAPAKPETNGARELLMSKLHDSACEGGDTFKAAWGSLTKTERQLVGEQGLADLKKLGPQP